jgi:hypothetical protein
MKTIILYHKLNTARLEKICVGPVKKLFVSPPEIDWSPRTGINKNPIEINQKFMHFALPLRSSDSKT